MAILTVRRSETVDDVKINVTITQSNEYDVEFLRLVATMVAQELTLQKEYLFIIASTGPTFGDATNYVIICSSSDDLLQRAVLLTSAKFVGRLESIYSQDNIWISGVTDNDSSIYDETALWDVARKSARKPMDPLEAPPGSKGIDQILTEVRAKLQRVTPNEAYTELQETHVGAPTFLMDIRPSEQRQRDGAIQGSLIIERNVLEWRFDPRSSARLKIADRYDLRIIVFCDEGYTSSLAAYALQEIGLLNATDIVGGYQAWRAAGLPVDVPAPRSVLSLAGSIV